MTRQSPNLRLWLLVYGACVGLMVSLHSHLTAPWLRELGFGPISIGRLMAVSTIFAAAANLTGGLAADRVGRRLIMIMGQLSITAGLILFINSRQPRALLGVMILWGLFSLGQPSLKAFLADSVTGQTRGATFGGYSAVVMICALLGPVLGGGLATRYSPMAAYAASILPAIAGLLIIIRIPVPVLVRKQKNTGAKIPVSAATIRIITLSLMLGLEMGLVRPVLGLLLVDKFGLSWASLGLITALATLAGAGTAAAGGFLSDKLGRGRVLFICLLPAAMLITFLPLATSLGQAATMIFVYNLLGSAAFPALAAMGMEAVPPGVRAGFDGLTSTALNLGAVAGSAISGWLYSQVLWLPFASAGIIVVLTFPPLLWALMPTVTPHPANRL